MSKKSKKYEKKMEKLRREFQKKILEKPVHRYPSYDRLIGRKIMLVYDNVMVDAKSICGVEFMADDDSQDYLEVELYLGADRSMTNLTAVKIRLPKRYLNSHAQALSVIKPFSKSFNYREAAMDILTAWIDTGLRLYHKFSMGPVNSSSMDPVNPFIPQKNYIQRRLFRTDISFVGITTVTLDLAKAYEDFDKDSAPGADQPKPNARRWSPVINECEYPFSSSGDPEIDVQNKVIERTNRTSNEEILKDFQKRLEDLTESEDSE